VENIVAYSINCSHLVNREDSATVQEGTVNAIIVGT